jgi:hypothetical protein
MRRQISRDELDSLYRAVGKAIWKLQYLEDVLHSAIALKVDLREGHGLSESEAWAALSNRRKLTLGRAIQIAEDKQVFPDELLIALREFKEKRDWLVHRSVHENSEDLYTDEGRARVFLRLSDILDAATALRDGLAEDLHAFHESHGGADRERVEQMTASRLARLRGEGHQAEGGE